MKYLINNLTTNWAIFLNQEFEQPYLIKLDDFLFQNQDKVIYPPKDRIFACFNFFDIEQTKVVIFGQDPYFNQNEATGLAFGVDQTIVTKIPPSLLNIGKELTNDLGYELTDYSLVKWAKQGVLLLNSQLTVFAKKPNSHAKIGWENFIHHVIAKLNQLNQPIVFLLMGNNAQKYAKLIASHHHLIKSVHPSPLSCYRGFFNQHLFSQINSLLIDKIKW